jgi:hypothetical protein
MGPLAVLGLSATILLAFKSKKKRRRSPVKETVTRLGDQVIVERSIDPRHPAGAALLALGAVAARASLYFADRRGAGTGRSSVLKSRKWLLSMARAFGCAFEKVQEHWNEYTPGTQSLIVRYVTDSSEELREIGIQTGVDLYAITKQWMQGARECA